MFNPLGEVGVSLTVCRCIEIMDANRIPVSDPMLPNGGRDPEWHRPDRCGPFM